GCNGNNIWDINGNINATGAGTNIENQDPLFVNGTSDIHLQSGSPALKANHNPSTTLYDMGPFGGPGFFNFDNASASDMPLIQTFSIGNPTIQSGTPLQINVTAKSHH